MGLIRISAAPGVQRDGTLFDSSSYADAIWCRMYRGRPRKMGGFREISRQFADLGRGMHVDTVNGNAYVHVGQGDKLERILIDIESQIASGVTDRTPAGFATDANNLWQFDSEFDVGTSANYILAHAAPNFPSIASDIAAPVYFGETTDTAALTAIASSDVSGGIVVLHPYMFVFGSDGYLGWSVAGEPTDLTSLGSGAVRPTASKIVRGMALRAGPGNSPAGLFWGLDTLSRVVFVGGTSIFSFDTITTSTSILSAASVIEHNGTYYWASLGGFLMFNGVVKEVPNNYNHAWFYKNINMNYAQRMFAVKMPLWGEIWWCFPKGAATECDWAVVYNYRENVWYDTPFLGTGAAAGRSCGYYEQVFPYPLMTGGALNSDDRCSLWQHEYGLDEVSGAVPVTLAIRSSFITNQINAITPSDNAPGQDREISVGILEPDLAQVGEMTVRVYGAANATVADPPMLAERTIPEPSDGAQASLPAFSTTQRLLQFEFESNTAGGDYQLGKILAHVEDGGDRVDT